MKTAGGWIARQREEFSAESAPNPTATFHDPLVERLSLNSIQALCSFFGWSLAEIQKRYERFA